MNRQQNNYQYHLTVLSIKMKVKFVCRMKIQYLGSFLTSQVPQCSNNKFIFNQQIKIKNDDHFRQTHEFTLHLITERGAKYIGGIVRLHHSQMISSQGQKLSLSVIKCIDSQAFCQVRVDQVLNSASRLMNYNVSSQVQRSTKKDNYLRENIYLNEPHQTKTQYNHNLGSSRNSSRRDSNKNKALQLSPNFKSHQEAHLSRRKQDHMNIIQDHIPPRQKKRDEQIYHTEYKKLNPKYRQQEQISKTQQIKRFNIESNNENYLKKQILKYKMQAQQYQRSLNEVKSKLKDYQNSYDSMNKQTERDMFILRQESQQKDKNIAEYKSVVQLLKQKNLELSRKNQYKTYQSDKNKESKLEYQQKYRFLQFQLKQFERQIKSLRIQLNQKQIEINMKTDQLEKAKKIISENEKQIQNKNMELKNVIENQKQSLKHKNEQLKSKIQNLSLQLSQKNKIKLEFQKQREISKQKNLKNEYEIKMLQQQIQFLRSQNTENKKNKEKYNEINSQHKSLLDEYQRLQKFVQKLVSSKQQNENTIHSQFQDQVHYYKDLYNQKLSSEKQCKSQLQRISQQNAKKSQMIEKMKKDMESSARQYQEMKQRQKNAKRALKQKEERTLGMQSEYQTLKQKVKIIDDIYQGQLQNIIQQNDSNKKKLTEQSSKNESNLLKLNSTLEQLSSTKIQLQTTKSDLQRAQTQLKQRQANIKQIIIQHEQNISLLSLQLSQKRKAQKELSNKNQKIEIQLIRLQQKLQKNKKESKIWEEKCNVYSVELRSRVNEKQSLNDNYQKSSIQVERLQKQNEALSTKLTQVDNQRNLLINKIDQISKELIETKNSLNTSNNQLQYKTVHGADRDRQLYTLREEKANLQIFNNIMTKQNQIDKQSLNQNIQKYIIFHLNSISSTKIQSKMDVSKLSMEDIINLISVYGKQLKAVILKLNQDIKQLSKQKEYLFNKNITQQQKNSLFVASLKQKIYDLEVNYKLQKENRQQVISNLQLSILQYKQHENNYQDTIQSLTNQLQQSNFNYSSLKLNYESINEQNNKKLTNLRRNNIELQQKLQEALSEVNNIQEINQVLQTKISQKQEEIVSLKEIIQKKQKEIDELSIQNINQKQMIQMIKNDKKQLTTKLNQNQMIISNEKQISQQLKREISNLQEKNKELNQFIHNLMKQKQVFIQKDIQNNEIINENEYMLKDSQSRYLLQEQQRLKNEKNVYILKEQLVQKKNYIKELQNQVEQYRTKINKIHHDLEQTDQQIKQLQNKFNSETFAYMRVNQEGKIQIKSLHQQIEILKSSNMANIKQFNDKIIVLESENQKYKINNNNFEQKVSQLQQQIFIKSERCFKLQEVIEKYQHQNLQLINKINLMDINVNQLGDQIKQKEQKLFQISGRSIQLEKQIQNREFNLNIVVENLNNQWNEKMESFYEQYQQRLAKQEHQKSFLKSIIEQNQNEFNKLKNQVKNAENSEINTRKQLQQKIKKIQMQKIHNLTIKNNQIHKIAEQIKKDQQSLQQKQLNIKKLTTQLQSSKRLNSSLQQKFKQTQQKNKNNEKITQMQIQQLKKKQLQYKILKQTIHNQQWTAQRQVKKIMQNFMRLFIDNQDKSSSKVVDMIRNLEVNLTEVINFKINEK